MSLQVYEICLFSISFALFVANIVYKNISSCKNVDLFSSAFKKVIPGATTPTFKKWVGVTQPLIFC